MENASKALIMAGSVLIAMLIIGALVFMFNQLRDVKSTEYSSEEAKKLSEYNKQIETFNRELYGSELLSLCNLIDDYNRRQADLQGYMSISIEIYTKGIADANYIKDKYISKNTSYNDLLSDFTKLEMNLNTAKNKKVEGERVEKLAGMKRVALIQLLMQRGKTQEQAETILDDWNSDINKAINSYNLKKSELTEFKNKKFQRPNYEYDNSTARVKKIVIKEQGL